MSQPQETTHWDTDIAGLLTELSAVQSEVLDVLAKKRELLVANDVEGMMALQSVEQQLISRLEACHDHRGRLLERAADEGLPSDSIRALTQALPRAQRQELEKDVQAAAARARLLQHQSLTNWVVVQRTLLHLAQLLEIIATGGRSQPTYGMGSCASSGGSLVDQAA